MSGFHVGPPRLISFSCHVREPDSGVAACQLNLIVSDHIVSDPCGQRILLVSHDVQVEDPDNKSPVGECAVKTVAMEVQPPTLATLLDGLGRIRDQLSTVAARKQ